MSKEQRPDWTACTVVDLESGKSRWREIGVGFTNEKSNTIKIKLDALPLNGQIVLLAPPRQGRGPDSSRLGRPFPRVPPVEPPQWTAGPHLTIHTRGVYRYKSMKTAQKPRPKPTGYKRHNFTLRADTSRLLSRLPR